MSEKMMNVEFLPCPFCGGKAHATAEFRATRMPERVICLSCSVELDGPGSIEQWQARASLPGGVPDGWALVPVEPTPEMIAAVVKYDREVMHATWVGTWREYLAAAPAAPTAKAERVDDSVEFGFDDRSVRVSQEAYAIFLDRESALRQAIQSLQDQLQEMQAKAPSLPAAGSAVETLDAVAWLCVASKEGVKTQRRIVETWAETKDFTDRYRGRGCKVVTTALVSKRKHVYIVAALSAQQSAPERVSVPVELVQKSIQHMEWFGKPAAKEVDGLRALLASHGRGEA